MRHTKDFAKPQLATLVDKPPSGEQWAHEIKFDGYRMVCWRDGAQVRIYTRNGNDWTERFPSLAKAVLALKCKAALIDGEIVVLDDKGVSSFARLQDAIARKTDLHIVYYAFDLLQLDGEDTRALALTARKEKLKRLLPAKAFKIQFSDHVVGDGAKVLKQACAIGLEGIVSKRIDAPYRPDRGLDWQKSKCLKRQEFVIVGYSERSNAKNDFGSLLLGAHEGGKLVYAGHVGTGWNERSRKAIYANLVKLKTPKPTVTLPAGESSTGVHWVKPKLVAEVAFIEWTNDGALRHPSFQGLREDKPARDVVIERPTSVPDLRGGGSWRKRR